MTKFENTYGPRLKRVDELIRTSYRHLKEEDEVYFLGEYTVGAGSEHSKTNRLIINYKKPLRQKEYYDWEYKEKAIIEAANSFRGAILNELGLSDRVSCATLVPVPPSFARHSVEYDDRNHRLLKAFMPKGDIRELYLQKDSRTPLHTSKST